MGIKIKPYVSRFKNMQWVDAIAKFTKGDPDKIKVIVDDYVGAGVTRLVKLNIAVRTNGKFFDKNINKDINLNHVKLILADDLEGMEADYPLPESRSERIKLADVILNSYADYAVVQLSRHFNGEELDEDIGRVVTIEDDR